MLPLDTSLRGVGASVTFSIRNYLKKSTYVLEKVQKKYNLSFICSVVWYPVLTSFFIVLIQHNISDNLPYEKVGKNEPVCIADEVPFEIPDNWEWVRLGNVLDIARGGSPRPIKSFLTDSPNGINWIKIGDADKGGKYIYSTKEKITPEGVSKSRMVYEGDFLLTNSMSFGRPYILKTRGCIHDGWLVLSDQHQCYSKDFLYILLSSSFAYNQFCEVVSGAVVKNLNSDKVSNALFPLPPLEEQNRIANKIEEFIPLIEKYGEAQATADSLNKFFPGNLKKSILQEAVQGKLVPQDENDEPASILLERIRAEKQALIKAGKIKKDKNESIIFRRDNSHYEKRGSEEVCIDDELPFEIPETWCWARMGSCLDVRDGTHDTPKYVPQGIPLVTSKNLCNGAIDFSTAKFISEEDHLAISQRSKVDAGDIMYAMIGSIGNPVLYNGNAEFSIKNMALFKKISNGLDMEYVYWFLYLSQDTMKKFASGGVQSFVSLGYLRNYWIPVPPIQEQHRIVTAIKQILPKVVTL